MKKFVKNYFLFTFILIISTFVMCNDGSYWDKFYDYMGWQESKEELPEAKEINFNQSLGNLDKFIKAEISHINSKIRSGAKVTHEGFVLLEWLEDEDAMSQLEKIITTIKEKSSEATQPELGKALALIEQEIVALNNARESLSNAQSLIAEANVDLYLAIDQSFTHLDKFNIDRLTIYEMLGLESAKRNEYTINDIIKKADSLNKVLDPQSQKSKQIRQIKFTIGNEIGKKIYDAWLSDKEKNITEHGHLSMLRIDPKDLDLMEVLSLSNRLLMEKAELDALKKIIEKKLK